MKYEGFRVRCPPVGVPCSFFPYLEDREDLNTYPMDVDRTGIVLIAI